MNYAKIVAVLLGIFSIGSIQEMFRIFTSPDKDIADNRSTLIPMSLIFTSGLIFGTFYFWKRSKKHGRL
jgi:hypothetical protein